MSRKKIVAGNWKMNKNIKESIELTENIKRKLSTLNSHCEVILAPTTLALSDVLKSTKDSQIKCASQNMHYSESGAFTGEVSPKMLEDCCVRYAIIGHSERRSIFNETDTLLTKKVSAALKYNLNPIFCIGESLRQRENNEHEKTIKHQLENGIFHLTESEFKNCVIAYEPVWAIGTGKTASKEQANEMHTFIRALISHKYGNATADNTSILYGGSVKPNNAKDLFSQLNIDGALVGGASLNADNFLKIINSF